MTELHGAAARQRRLAEPDVCHEDVYPGPTWRRDHERDVEVLAEAWLTEHPADDDKPTAADWLLAVGLVDEHYNRYRHPSAGFGVRKTSFSPALESWYFCCLLTGEFDGQEIYLVSVPTRGHVRRAFGGVGVALEEGSQ